MGELIDITDMFDRHVEAVESERKPDGKWHPSSMWGCPREAMLGVRAVPPTRSPDAESLRRFWFGHTIGEFAADAINLYTKAAYPEFKIDWQELNIAGAGDSLVQLDDDTWVVVEIKSIKKAGLRRTPLDHHIKQASVYSVAAHDEGVTTAEGVVIPPLGDKLRGIILWYFEKENGETRQFFVPYDGGAGPLAKVIPGSWRKKIEERVAYLETFRTTGWPACKSHEPGEMWRQTFCAYFPACNMGEEEFNLLVEADRLDPPLF